MAAAGALRHPLYLIVHWLDSRTQGVLAAHLYVLDRSSSMHGEHTCGYT